MARKVYQNFNGNKYLSFLNRFDRMIDGIDRSRSERPVNNNFNGINAEVNNNISFREVRMGNVIRRSLR